MNSTVEDSRAEQRLAKRQEKSGLARFLRRYGPQLGILTVFALMWLSFILSAPKTFLAPQIYLAFMSTIPFFAIIALPLTMLVIAGEMDLSFPSIMAIGMVAFVTVLNAIGNVFLALLAGLAAGFLAGLLNGAIVVGIGLPSLVVTIGTQFFWRGAVLVLLNGKGHTLAAAKGSFIYSLLVGKVAGIPMQMIWLVVAAVAVWILLNRHRFGANIYVIGDNKQTAELMGVNTARTRMLMFALVGMAAAFAGILASLQVSFFWPSLGEGYLLSTLAAVFLGGTSVFGGVGTILGTFIGSFIIGAIQAAIVAIGLTGFWTELIYGLIIILSVSMHAILRRRVE
ncbi:MAG: ABC transporter permease [Anaerolineae bacterium]|nr:ABC transporter permease [Anaerolineales bacterium]MCQ3979050.1 ABC transporter permease [Anaerolineae bacterium]